jgi:hypothetical protein
MVRYLTTNGKSDSYGLNNFVRPEVSKGERDFLRSRQTFGDQQAANPNLISRAEMILFQVMK